MRDALITSFVGLPRKTHTNLAETDFTQTQQEQTPNVHKSPLAEQGLLQRCLPTIPYRPPLEAVGAEWSSKDSR